MVAMSAIATTRADVSLKLMLIDHLWRCPATLKESHERVSLTDRPKQTGGICRPHRA
jgi:hypothetical protein